MSCRRRYRDFLLLHHKLLGAAEELATFERTRLETAFPPKHMFKLSDELEHERIEAFSRYLRLVQRLPVPCAKVRRQWQSTCLQPRRQRSNRCGGYTAGMAL